MHLHQSNMQANMQARGSAAGAPLCRPLPHLLSARSAASRPPIRCGSSDGHYLLVAAPSLRLPAGQRRAAAVAAAAAGGSSGGGQQLAVDVVVVGSGVIGLCTALALLQADDRLSVGLLDRAVPCSGATGAGQGYLWMAHRDPASPAWDLAAYSTRLWEEWLEAEATPALTLEAVELQPTGSMLIASTAEESAALRMRQALLAAAGVRATHAEAGIAARLEPALSLGPDASALLVPDDLQINGRRTAAALQAACEAHGPRFRALFHEGAEALVAGPSGRVEGVRTPLRTVHASRGVVVAAGAWSGPFLAQQLGFNGSRWAEAFRPRKGLLLEMPRPEGMPEIERGLMEVGYTKHYDRAGQQAASGSDASATAGVAGSAAEGGTAAAAAAAAAGPPSSSSEEGSRADITFTATTSASGTLLVGSSRQFAGFDSDPDPEVLDAIMQRAVQFLPGLAGVKREDISVRAGPRPYAARGLPFVGPVPGAEGLFIAAGHEGSGLTLGPASAELLCHHVLGTQTALPVRVVEALLP